MAVSHLDATLLSGPIEHHVRGRNWRVAESIEALGDIQVQDLVMHTDITADGAWHY